MFHYFKKGKNNWNAKKDLCKNREGAVTDWMCQKWFGKFHAGDFSLDDGPWLGRPVEVDSNQTETLIEHKCYTTQEIADILKMSKSIKLLVKMNNVSFILQKESYRLFGQPNKSAMWLWLMWLSWLEWVGALPHTPKGRQFNSWSGHIPSCRFIPSQGTYRRQPINVSLPHQWFSLSLPSPLSQMRIF